MKTVMIILGPECGGKTTKARELTKGRKALWLTSENLKSRFGFSEVTEDTEVLVFEEGLDINAIKTLMSLDKIEINRRGYYPIEIEMPDLIIISNKHYPKDFTTRPKQKIIVCNYQNINWE